MKFQYFSDLHIELLKKEIDPKDMKIDGVENLFLLGDIGKVEKKSYHIFISKCSAIWKNVFLVLGNHEYYSKKYTMKELEDVCTFQSNVHFLQNNKRYLDLTTNEVNSFVKDNCIKIIGCTLWSDIKDHAAMDMNDYYCINTCNSKLTPDVSKGLFKESKKYILDELNEEIPTILLTHHGVDNLCNGKYIGSALQTAFATDIPELKKFKHLKACFNGHTHVHINSVIPGTDIKLLSNCIGYKGEDTGYIKDSVYEL